MRERRSFSQGTTCPHCGSVFDCMTRLQMTGGRPGLGNIAVCTECGEISRFDDGMQLRKLTARETLEVFMSPVAERLDEARRRIRAEKGLG
jgi:hypothetical protein